MSGSNVIETMQHLYQWRCYMAYYTLLCMPTIVIRLDELMVVVTRVTSKWITHSSDGLLLKWLAHMRR